MSGRIKKSPRVFGERCELLETRLCLSAIGFASTTLPMDVPVAEIRKASAVEINADEETDIVIHSVRRISWHHNLGELNSFEESRSFETSKDVSHWIIDIDGDQVSDLVVASGIDIAWHRQLADDQYDRARPIGEYSNINHWWIGDIDGDSDNDIVLLFGPASEIQLYENSGEGDFEFHRFSTNRIPISFDAGDFNNDGLMDFAVNSMDGVSVFMNAASEELSFDKTVLSELTSGFFPTEHTQSIDFDGDGDQDIITSQASGELIYTLHRNLDGEGRFASEELLVSTGRVKHGNVIDLDADGDLDLVAWAGWNVHWFENTPEGFDDAWKVIGRSDAFPSYADLDLDGRIDVLAAIRSNVIWYQQLLQGDVNRDGIVDFEDFLKLSSSFGQSVDSWDDGDLDGDGRVSFADFLALADNFE